MHERGSEEKKQDTKVLLLLLLLMLMVNNARNNFDKKIYILSTFKPTARQSDRQTQPHSPKQSINKSDVQMIV